MPRLIQLLPQADAFPSQTGEPRSGVNIPVVPLPQPAAGLGSALTQGAQSLGVDLERTGRGLIVQERQEAALQAQLRKVQDTIASQQRGNAFTVALDTAAEEIGQTGDYATYGARLQERSARLVQEYSQGLTPQAQQLFTVDAGNYLAIRHRDLIKQGRDRTLAEGKAIFEDAKQVFTRGMLESPTEELRAFHALKFRTTTESLAADGVLFPADAAREFAATVEDVEKRQNVLAIMAHAKPMLEHLTALSRGERGSPDLPTPAMKDLPALIDLAEREVDQQAVRENRRIAQATVDIKKRQEMSEVTLTNRISLAQGMAELETIEDIVRRQAADGGLIDESQRRLLGAVEARRARIESGAAGGARLVSDVTRRRAWRATALSGNGERSTQELLALHAQVLSDPGLAEQDATAIAQDFQRQMSENHITKLPGYSEAEHLLSLGFQQAGGRFGAVEPSVVGLEIRARQSFRNNLQTILEKDGRRAAIEAAPRLVDQLLEDFNVQMLSAVRQSLQVPPQVPLGVFRLQADPAALTEVDIAGRLLDAQAKIRADVIAGAYPQAEGIRYLEMVKQRADFETAYWYALRARGEGTPNPEPPKPPEEPRGFFQRATDYLGLTGGEPSAPQESETVRKARELADKQKRGVQ